MAHTIKASIRMSPDWTGSTGHWCWNLHLLFNWAVRWITAVIFDVCVELLFTHTLSMEGKKTIRIDEMIWHLCTEHIIGWGTKPFAWVKERSESHHWLRVYMRTSSHPGLANLFSVEARKLCREQRFFSLKPTKCRSQDFKNFFSRK